MKGAIKVDPCVSYNDVVFEFLWCFVRIDLSSEIFFPRRVEAWNLLEPPLSINNSCVPGDRPRNPKCFFINATSLVPIDCRKQQQYIKHFITDQDQTTLAERSMPILWTQRRNGPGAPTSKVVPSGSQPSKDLNPNHPEQIKEKCMILICSVHIVVLDSMI